MGKPLQDLAQAFEDLAKSKKIKLDQFCTACDHLSAVLQYVSSTIKDQYAKAVKDLSDLSSQFKTLKQVGRDSKNGWKLEVVNRALRYANRFFDNLVKSKDWDIGTAAARAYHEVYAKEGNVWDWFTEQGINVTTVFERDLVSAVGEENKETAKEKMGRFVGASNTVMKNVDKLCKKDH